VGGGTGKREYPALRPGTAPAMVTHCSPKANHKDLLLTCQTPTHKNRSSGDLHSGNPVQWSSAWAATLRSRTIPATPPRGNGPLAISLSPWRRRCSLRLWSTPVRRLRNKGPSSRHIWRRTRGRPHVRLWALASGPASSAAEDPGWASQATHATPMAAAPARRIIVRTWTVREDFQMPADHVGRADRLMAAGAAWCGRVPSIRGLALVGSRARGRARGFGCGYCPAGGRSGGIPRRLLVEGYRVGPGRRNLPSGGAMRNTARSGRGTSNSMTAPRSSSGSLSWANPRPIDPGTARVVSDGCRILRDPDGLFRTVPEFAPWADRLDARSPCCIKRSADHQ